MYKYKYKVQVQMMTYDLFLSTAKKKEVVKATDTLTDAVKATDTNWASIIAATFIVRHISVLCRSSTAVGHVIILNVM